MSSSTIISQTQQAIKNFVAFVNKYNPENISGEKTVYFEDGSIRYAGTYDRKLYVHDPKRKKVLIDWKITDKADKEEYELQLEAYYRAEPDVTELWVVALPKERDIDFDKDVIKYKPCRKRFSVFLNLLHYYNWTRSRK